MSGHSKWSQIKRQKGAADVKKSQIFSKIAKTISLAAKKGDKPDMNPDLRIAIEKAKEANMPADNIERAIKKGSGKLEGISIEAARYEAYGPGGTAIIIEVITDNKNRAVAEIKHILSKRDSRLAEPGSVIWAFEKTGDKWKAKQNIALSMEDSAALNNLLEDLNDHEDVNEVFTNTS